MPRPLHMPARPTVRPLPPRMSDGRRRICVKKLGIRVNPPILIMVYRDNGKYRQRKMPVRNFTLTSDCVRAGRDLKKRHAPYLDPVPNVRLERLLRLIQESTKVARTGAKPDLNVLKAKVAKEFRVDKETDLNKVSPEELRRQKDLMEEGFQKSVVKPEDKDFVYDKRVDFEASTSGEAKAKSDWDSDGDDKSDGTGDGEVDDDKDKEVLVVTLSDDDKASDTGEKASDSGDKASDSGEKASDSDKKPESGEEEKMDEPKSIEGGEDMDDEEW